MGRLLPRNNRPLPQWSKAALKALIDNDMSVEVLAERIDKTREYTSSVLYGRVYSEAMVNAISDVLNISNDYK